MNDFKTNTRFGNRTEYGKELDKDIDRFGNSLADDSEKAERIKKLIGEEKSAIIKRGNKESLANIESYRNETDSIQDTYNKSIEDRRVQADSLVDRQKEAAGLEASISAAGANQSGGKLAVSQLTSINKDITNSFNESINNSIKDNINFQMGLDTKLADMGFSVIDKKRVLDEFKKVLLDKEAAPLLDAITQKYKTRESFMKALSDTIKGINKGQIKDSTSTIQRSERLERDESAFSAMNPEQKARDIRARFGITWNILTPAQKQEIINNTVNGTQSLRETLDMIKNFKSQSETNIIERQQMLASGDEDLGKDIYRQSSVNARDKIGTSSGDKNYTGSTIEQPVPNSRTSTEDISSSLGTSKPKKKNKHYKVGNITYTSRKDYNMLRKQGKKLKDLKQSNPTAFERAVKLIKDKYIIN